MYIAARKRRYRRICKGGAANPPGVTGPIVFDRLESLQHKTQTEKLHQSLDMVLVTSDNYLSLALTQHIFKRQQMHVCTRLEEAEPFLEQSPLPRMLIDLDGVDESIIDMLDTARRWQKARPCLDIVLVTACQCAQTTHFIKTASSCRVVERRQGVSDLSNLLLRQPDSSRSDLLSHREWKILLEVAKGDSLKAIALSLKKPYHSVVYTIGKVNARIGLGNSKALIHLLNKLSRATSAKQ